MKKIFLALTVLILLGLSLNGRSEITVFANTGSLEKVTVLLEWVPNTNHTGLYTAQALEYYKQQGLDVEIIQAAEGGTAQLIAAGKAKFGMSHQEETTYARIENMPVVAVATIIQHNTSGFASPAYKEIKTPADFEGKKYGGWGSPIEEAILKAFMDKYNADFNKLEMVSIGAMDFFTSVERYVDFTWIYYGWDGIAAELRGMDLNFIDLRKEGLDFYSPIIITSEDTVQNNPELIRRFLKATAEGYKYAINHPEEAAEFLLEACPELDKELVIASQKYLSTKYLDDASRWGEMTESMWNDYAEWLFEKGLIKSIPEPGKAFTNEFLPEE